MNDLARESLDRGLENQAALSSDHKRRVKTHSVRIRGMSFRCEPGGRREQILLELQRIDRKGQGLPHFVAGLIAGCIFLLGFAAGWLI